MSEFTEAGDAIVHQEDPEPASEWTRVDKCGIDVD